MTVDTFTPNTNDGVLSCVGSSYANACAGTGTISQYPGDNTSYGVGYGTDPAFSQIFMSFDTSSIPAENTVTAATLSVAMSNNLLWSTNVIGNLEVYAYNWTPDTGFTPNRITTTDFRSATQLSTLYNSGNGLFASHSLNYDLWDTTIGANVQHVLDAGPAATAGIVKGGTTKLILTIDHQRLASTQPDNQDNISFHSADHATSGYRPILSVTHNAPVGFVGMTVYHNAS